MADRASSFYKRYKRLPYYCCLGEGFIGVLTRRFELSKECHGRSGRAEETLGPFPAFAPTEALAYSTPRDTSGGSETRPAKGIVVAGTNALKAKRPGARGGRAEPAGQDGGRTTVPSTSSGPSRSSAKGARRGEARRAAPAGSPGSQEPRALPSGPSPCHPPWQGRAGRRDPPGPARFLPSEQETAAAASGPA